MAKSNRHSFPIVGSFNVERIPKLDDQQTINQYEVIDPQSKKPRFLAPTPGYGNKLTVPAGNNVRASFVFKDIAYIVSGNSLFRLDAALAFTGISPPVFSTSTGHVSVEASTGTVKSEVAFADGTSLLVYDVGLASLGLVAPGFIVADITYMDGFFIAVKKDSNVFFVSALNDGTTWPPLNFALVTTTATSLVGCQRLKRRLFLFGEDVTEVWLDAGLADFPFRRDNNLLIEHGLGAVGSLVEGFDLMFYLSKDKDGYSAIQMVRGTVPKPISNEAIELQIQDLTNPADAEAFVYRINGNIFYQINFTEDNKTFVYNVNMARWHTLEMLDNSRHTANTHMFFNTSTGTKHFIGAYNEGAMYELSQNLITNNGEAIRRTRVAHVLASPLYNRIRIDRFQLDLLQGVGASNNETTIGPAPQLIETTYTDKTPEVFLSISRDGGRTFQNFGPAAMGKIGEFRARTSWSLLGTAREHIIKIVFYNRLEWYVLGASIDMEELPE